MKLPNPLIWVGLKRPPKNEFTKFSKKFFFKKMGLNCQTDNSDPPKTDCLKFQIRSKYSVKYGSQTQSPDLIGSSSVASQNGGSTDYIFPFKLRILQGSRHLFNY